MKTPKTYRLNHRTLQCLEVLKSDANTDLTETAIIELAVSNYLASVYWDRVIARLRELHPEWSDDTIYSTTGHILYIEPGQILDLFKREGD